MEGESQTRDAKDNYMDTLLLASSSPRRAELLAQIGIRFEVIRAGAEEAVAHSEGVEALARANARVKLEGALHLRPELSSSWILAADTLIELDGEPLGKASNVDEARKAIERLSGREHSVITSLALNYPAAEAPDIGSARSTVRFSAMSVGEIDAYLASGEWEGVAGSYRIQGLAARHIESIDGCYGAVVGLPLSLLYGMLKSRGFRFS
jgi:septum formation protein